MGRQRMEKYKQNDFPESLRAKETQEFQRKELPSSGLFSGSERGRGFQALGILGVCNSSCLVHHQVEELSANEI